MRKHFQHRVAIASTVLAFLIRGVNCKGKGSYDSGGGGQSGSRDAGVAGSGNDCS